MQKEGPRSDWVVILAVVGGWPREHDVSLTDALALGLSRHLGVKCRVRPGPEAHAAGVAAAWDPAKAPDLAAARRYFSVEIEQPADAADVLAGLSAAVVAQRSNWEIYISVMPAPEGPVAATCKVPRAARS